MNVEEHAEELAADLGADKEAVTRDLENLLAYSVPVDEAKQSLRRKYGGGDTSPAEPEPRSVGDITTDDANVAVTATVLTVGTRSIRYQGEDQVIREGELADESGRLSYTAWEDFGFEPGDTVSIRNANVREWQGSPELNLGSSTTITEVDEALDVPYDVGGEAALADLEPGDRGVTVDVVALEVEEKTIDGRDGETEILSGVLADESARLPFTDWDPHDAIAEGETIRIGNAYVREFRGVPSVNVSEFSTVEALDEAIEPGDAATMAVGEAVAKGGVYDVAVTGHVVGVREGSGLIQRCPECGRVVQKGQCRSHGEVEAEDDLRVKAILDDGTGAVTAVLDDELTAEVYGGSLDDALEAAREAMDTAVVADAIADRIVGREYRVRGNLSVDDYGANLQATTFDRVEAEPADRAAALLEVVGR
ncbi:MAG: Single-stranded DNA binding protein [Halobacteriales archaeon]|nr:Single-stranded DNA binding protein [Halobacteriales archaeon]